MTDTSTKENVPDETVESIQTTNEVGQVAVVSAAVVTDVITEAAPVTGENAEKTEKEETVQQEKDIGVSNTNGESKTINQDPTPPPVANTTTSSTNVVDDDSDEEDEDYVPPPDDDINKDSTTNQSLIQNGNAGNGNTMMLSFSKQQAVDSAFSDLFGDTTVDVQMEGDEDEDRTSCGKNNASKKKKIKKKKKTIAASKKAMKKKRQILSDIFGTTTALKLISRSSSSSSSSSTVRRSISLSSARNATRKKQIIEKKVFAGQTIEIKRTVVDEEASRTLPSETETTTKASNADKSSTQNIAGQQIETIQQQQQQTNHGLPKKPTSNIDKVLSRISNENSKISTIDKTNIDWENYKEDHLNDTLKDQLQSKVKSNDAYLEKQDFLKRVDQRRFEQEKSDRDRQRAASAAVASQGSKK